MTPTAMQEESRLMAMMGSRSSFRVWRCTAAFALALLSATAQLDAATKHLIIVGTNDLHGALGPRRQTRDTREGGIALLAGFVDVLRRENPNRVLWLDAGDEFQGSIESNSTKGASMVSALSAAGVTAAAIGNHEFDFGPAGPDAEGGGPRGALRARMREAHYPLLAANIVERTTARSPFGANDGSTIRDVDGIRVGIVGLTTTMTSVATWPPYVRDLSFDDLRSATLREVKRLRQHGAEVVLLVAHVGIKCEEEARARCSGELVDLMHALPSGTLDAVVSGHSHTLVATRIDGVPVVQAGWKGEYLNVIDLPFDLTTRRVLREAATVEGPIRNRVPTTFHRVRVKPNRTVERVVQPVLARVAPIRSRLLATSDRALERNEDHETAMGDLVADALREATHADVAIVNAGGIRAGLPAGKITYGDAFESLPFENKVAVLRVSGRQLKDIVRVGESGAMGYFPISGLRVTIDRCEPCPADDLDGDGKIERWETHRLNDVVRADGSRINDDGEYTLATTDFVLQGGDYMGWAIGRVPADHIRYTPLLARDVFVSLLERLQHLGSAAAVVGDSEQARMLFIRHGASSVIGGQ